MCESVSHKGERDALWRIEQMGECRSDAGIGRDVRSEDGMSVSTEPECRLNKSCRAVAVVQAGGEAVGEFCGGDGEHPPAQLAEDQGHG